MHVYKLPGIVLGLEHWLCLTIKVQMGLPTPAVGGTVSTPVSS